MDQSLLAPRRNFRNRASCASMSVARFLFAIACLATAADALVVGGRGVSSLARVLSADAHDEAVPPCGARATPARR